MDSQREQVRDDFDRIARFPSGPGRYDDFVLAQVPGRCRRVLEVGCGTGLVARRLAARAEGVTAIDLSPAMIEVARSESAACSNLEFKVADVTELSFPEEWFDCCLSMATLHHLPFEETLLRLAGWLRPGGVLLIHDLFRDDGVVDRMLSAVVLAAELPRRWSRPANPEAARAWAAHGAHDQLMTLPELRRRAQVSLPGARMVRHLRWRYTLIWRKPG